MELQSFLTLAFHGGELQASYPCHFNLKYPLNGRLGVSQAGLDTFK